ncbi:MAG: methyl-accepting chemotaxis protein [Pseudomonadota bacterium]
MSEDDRAQISEMLRHLRHAQGYALNAAAILIEVTTAESEAARNDVALQFSVFRDRFSEALALATEGGQLGRRDARAPRLIDAARVVGTRLAALDAKDNFSSVTPEEAGRIVNFVRLNGVPAIMQLTSILGGAMKEHDRAVQLVMQQRLSKLDTMFTEVETIGRMIHLISLNASVEAARAGGASGRSFKVIADEIRGLAQQAAVLIETTRAGVLTGAEAEILGLGQR